MAAASLSPALFVPVVPPNTAYLQYISSLLLHLLGQVPW